MREFPLKGESLFLVEYEPGEGGRKEDRTTVARFHHARARALWQSGDYDGARDRFRRAVEVWRDVRREFSDEDLNALCKD